MGRFQVGDTVRIARADPPGHVRTPRFLRGHRGTIIRDFGKHPNPERLAYGMSGLPALSLYQVLFRMDEVWQGKGTYEAGDTVTADIYEHWLDVV